MIRDELVVVGMDRSYEPYSGTSAPSAERKGGHGHDRKKDSSSGSHNNGNAFASVLEFFAGRGKNKNKAAAAAAAAAADADRPDATAVSTTPLTAHDSDPGEDYCSELHDNEPGPLLDTRCSFYPPMAGGQQRRRTSQPVAIKRGPGTRARAPRPPEPAGGVSGNVECAGEGREGGEGGEEREAPGDDAESKIKAWQRRRMSAKRESFTVRQRDPREREEGKMKKKLSSQQSNVALFRGPVPCVSLGF